MNQSFEFVEFQQDTSNDQWICTLSTTHNINVKVNVPVTLSEALMCTNYMLLYFQNKHLCFFEF